MKILWTLVLLCGQLVLSLHTKGQSILPSTSDSSMFDFSLANIHIKVNAGAGGRINSLTIDDTTELLYTNTSINNWGATFWISPQTWSWPPSRQLDINPYHVSSGNAILQLTSEADTDKGSGMKFIKEFDATLLDTSLTINYTIVNTLENERSVSPWEVTRFPAGGLTFFPTGPSVRASGPLADQLQQVQGITWYDYDSLKIPSKGTPKFFCDGSEGWLAHIDRNRNLVLKIFSDTPDTLKAPDPENEIEHYTVPDQSYQESEIQGPYTLLGAGDSLKFSVKWVVRKVPAFIRVEIGNDTLMHYVRSLVSPTLVTSRLKKSDDVSPVSVFPNPATSQLSVKSTNSFLSLSIRDIAGKKVADYDGLQMGLSPTIDIDFLMPGMYLLHCIQSNASATVPFAKE